VTTLAWVIGAGGMLGTALRRALAARDASVFMLPAPLPWSDPIALVQQLDVALRQFAVHAARAQRWQVYWAAGVGSMGSAAAELTAETHALACLLDGLRGSMALRQTPGALVFAGSAGGVYGGCVGHEAIDERTPPQPINAYGVEKLHQEALVRAFADSGPPVAATTARISTLYGPRRHSGKAQGLLNYMARSVVRMVPMNVYVPLDTIRDYIHADDAAAAMVGLADAAVPGAHLKIVASEHPTTVAQIVATFRRVARRSPPLITSTRVESALYARRMQFRSVTPRADPAHVDKSLLVGVSELLAFERASFAAEGGRV
jgi:UDP-glucose 4-epimerase